MAARRDPSSPDRAEAGRTRSGPADVPVALLVAARKGDPGAFARFLEHWDPHVRPFVHHVLAGDGPTDVVLAAAYVRAYRALPRYRAEQTPGLWLHRIAYLAAVDELRRATRDPTRRRARTHGVPQGDPTSPGPTSEPVALALRHLAPDQRALAVLVDLEGFREGVVADAFGTGAGVVASRLGSARRVLDRAAGGDASPETTTLGRHDLGGTAPTVPADEGLARRASLGGRGDPAGVLGGPLVAGSPDAPPAPTTASAARPGRPGSATARRTPTGPPGGGGGGDEGDDGTPPELTPPAWFDDGAVRLVAADRRDDGSGAEAGRPGEVARAVGPGAGPPEPGAAPVPADIEVSARVRRALAALDVPAAGSSFWADLGRRLIAERERPAAPPPDPVARLARAHPAELGFSPSRDTTETRPPTVSSLAHQAGRTRRPRSWARPLGLVAGVAVVAAVVVAAVSFGTSSRPRDGSVTTTELAATIAEAFGATPYLAVDATIVTPGNGDGPAEQAFRVTLGSDGSWAVTRTGAFDQVTFEATFGVLRQVLVLPGAGGAEPTALVVEDVGLAAGAPDPAAIPAADGPLHDLRAVPTLLRAAGDLRAAPTRTDGMQTWTAARTLATGPDGERERWLVAVRRSDGLPVRIDRRRDGRLVRRVTFRSWTPSTEVPPETFAQALPAGPTPRTTSHGFTTGELSAVAFLGRGDAVTPGWLPEGFELVTVALRPAAPAGEPTTAGGDNPADVAVASLGYQRGPERITLSFRDAGPSADDWQDPFAGGTDADDGRAPVRRRLGDGRYNQAPVSVATDAVGRARLWGIAEGTVFTVAGDLTDDEAYRVAASLR